LEVSPKLGYQHALKLEREIGERAVGGLREFGDWARNKFIEDVQNTIESPLALVDGPGLDLDLDELQAELLAEHPHGYDWTGISDAVLLQSPNQVVYVSIDNPNDTRLARDVLSEDTWPTPPYRPHSPNGSAFQIPMELGVIDTPRVASPVLWWEEITWPQFVGSEAMSALFEIMDDCVALQVWASIAEAEYRARRTFDGRVGDWADRSMQWDNIPTNLPDHESRC
jgi:hypothetical protein